MNPLRKLPTPFVVETDFWGDPLIDIPEGSEPIFKLEAMLMEGNKNGTFKPTVCHVDHFFAPGVYVRQMFIPAGVCTIGHIHKYPCVTMVSYGDILITTQNGQFRHTGACTFESPAMVKRAVYAIKDTLLTTIHGNPTDERDTDKVFANLIVDVYEKLTGHPSQELIEEKTP